MKIPCPICKKLTLSETNPYKPFCSEKCKLVDLGAWLDESYRVADQSGLLSDKNLTEDEEKVTN
jgi:endogenous inhibitor of DNA gyrase (YacG/DUF329 family)